ncbi:MAG TPA: response regulator transcription factor [Mycobacterium sp.]|nr:response regulator transcription factor [Mycobacterium sp.]
MGGRVLFVEDDRSIRQVTTLALEEAGFRVTTCADGEEALAAYAPERFDVVLLDVMLPGRSGFDVCREIRRAQTTPIVMLTARTSTIDIVTGLELGADDYVAKPFQPPELVARIRAVLRRGVATSPPTTLRVGDLEIDEAAFRVTRDGVELNLTATEFRLLCELARRPGQVFTREMLLDQVWGYDYLGDSRLVNVAVQRLRAKVEVDPAHPLLISTVRGVGYRFERQ